MTQLSAQDRQVIPGSSDRSAQRRVLVATYGSAGDLFPLVPVIQRLHDRGHEIRCAAPRALTLYLRTLGLPSIGLGDGREMQVLGDDELVTTRFDGWESWFRVTDRYVAGSLERDVAALEKVVARWRPDVVVTSSFAAAARIVADRHVLSHVPVSIYPSMQSVLTSDSVRVPRRAAGVLDSASPARAGLNDLSTRTFARRYTQLCESLVGASHGGRADRTALAWGVSSETVILHDPVLLHRDAAPPAPGTALSDASTGRSGGAGSLVSGQRYRETGWVEALVGFPYWDAGLEDRDDVARVDQWFQQGSDPLVVVTMGSFLGASRSRELARLAREVTSGGARVLVMGPGAAGLEIDDVPSGAVQSAGFVRLSRVVDKAAVVVHHGGIGSTFGTLRAGVPAVVVPRAFDQPFNARLVQQAGVGIAAEATSPGGVGAAVTTLLGDETFRLRAEDAAARLIPTDQAVARLEARLLAAISEGNGA